MSQVGLVCGAQSLFATARAPVWMDVKVSIVEDDAPYRESLSMLLDGMPGFQCVGLYSNAEQAIKEVRRAKPDVVVMDINLPHASGIACVRALREQMPDLAILMLTAYEETELIFEALKAGACGYLLKRNNPRQVLDAISEVAQGGSPMAMQIARKVIQHFHQWGANHRQIEELTPREKEVLDQLARGYRNKEIADSLKMGEVTVRTHLRSIYRKLHVNSGREAVIKYFGNPLS
jgi:DNA-binding NarL/FixJ family response regulator